MVTKSAQRVMRRLTKAEGYLELGMPDQALLELKSIEDPGPFSVPHLLMTAAALKAQGRTDEASESLRKVAQNLPKVSSQEVWISLGKFLSKMSKAIEPADLEKILDSVGLKPLTLAVAKIEPESQSETEEEIDEDEIRVEIPNFGSFSVKVEPGQSLTIKIERPSAAPEDDSDDDELDDEKDAA